MKVYVLEWVSSYGERYVVEGVFGTLAAAQTSAGEHIQWHSGDNAGGDDGWMGLTMPGSDRPHGWWHISPRDLTE